MFEQVIKQILENTKLYEEKYNKESRREHCQFFTPNNVAEYMCKTFTQDIGKTVKVLEPSGGTGILVVYILKHLIEVCQIDEVIVDIYEIDSNILPVLETNIKLIEENIKAYCKCKINIIKENYILKNKKNWNDKSKEIYDLIIGNPPYKKISKNSKEAICMINIIFGQPNLYMLFLAMAISQLKNTGQLVFLIPRSFCNGRYFKVFREWMKCNCYIASIHSFEDRHKIINDEVLQELVILKLTKEKINDIILSHSKNNGDIDTPRIEIIHAELIWEQSEMNRIRLPLAYQEIELLKKFDKLPLTFEKLGITFSTGQIVDFRIKEGLGTMYEEDMVPLVWSAHFTNDLINWPINKNGLKQYISEKANSKILIESSNLVLVKRFSSKEENSIKVNILCKNKVASQYIGIENHVNYARFKDNETEMMIATYILLKSKLYNRYFKIINGTTQINVSDLNTLPCFSMKEMIEIGSMATIIEIDKLTQNDCDRIVNKKIEVYY